MCRSIPDSVEPRALRQTLAQFPTGVAVVTTRDQADRTVGLTINSFSSISLAPPLVAWCVGRESARYELFANARGFTISVLSQRQQALAQRFTRYNDAILTELPDTGYGPENSPGIHSACAWLHCTTYQRILLGDHLMLVGQVISHRSHATPPLVFAGGQYQQLAASADNSTQASCRTMQ